ncbi:MAG: NAD(P)H-dependent oxidoreductase [Anaerolineae bacterium]|nr:NAD(P)H-dependent oxidoreductase [Anaerolineae bacterium]
MQKRLKKLVIYYSLEGHTRLIAKAIAAEIEAELLELRPHKELQSRGLMRYVWGGGQVVMQRRPKLEPFSIDPGAYDLLFIGTPVWASSYAPPLRTFFSRVKLRGKAVALFCTNEGSPGKTLIRMRAALAGNDILGEADFPHPMEAERAAKWARQMLALLR